MLIQVAVWGVVYSESGPLAMTALAERRLAANDLVGIDVDDLGDVEGEEHVEEED